MAQNNNKTLTAQDVLNWHGSDGNITDLADYLANILNGKQSVADAKEEILAYKEDNED